MKTSNKIMALSLATCLTLSPLAVSANSENEEIKMVPINVKTETVIEAEKIVEAEKVMADYIGYEGKITEINKNKDLISILVKDNEEEMGNGEVLHINEKVTILNDKTKDFMKVEDLKVGMKITRYTGKNTPVTLSLPPQLTPEVIVVNEGEDAGTVNISKFDKELVNTDNTLKLLPSEESIIIDEAGETVAKEDLIDKDLIVFYTISTRSIPAQTTPEKIIVMDEEKAEEDNKEEVEEVNKLTVLDKLIINEKEVSLDKSLYENKDGIVMIPLRQISETLGYEVKWNNSSQSVELTKDAQWTSVEIGKDNYNFAKMIVKLGTAPELKDATTFVPLSFLEEVLKVNVSILEDGLVNILE